MKPSTIVRADRQYTKEHEWALEAANEVLIGITAFAVDQLGDITLVDFSVSTGDLLATHQVFGTVESVKTLSDLFSPIAGRVTRINQELLTHPEWLNEDCWEKSWMIAVEPTDNETKFGSLLEPSQYQAHLAELDR